MSHTGSYHRINPRGAKYGKDVKRAMLQRTYSAGKHILVHGHSILMCKNEKKICVIMKEVVKATVFLLAYFLSSHIDDGLQNTSCQWVHLTTVGCHQFTNYREKVRILPLFKNNFQTNGGDMYHKQAPE